MPISPAGKNSLLVKTRRFTMIELIVVLVVITLVTGLVVPRIGRLPQGLLIKTTSSRLVSAFRDAALRARAQGVTVRLVYDPETQRLQLEQDSIHSQPVAPEAAEAVRDPGLFRTKTFKMPRGVTLTLEDGALNDSPPAFVFLPDGAASGPRLKLAIGKLSYQLEVDALTGRPMLIQLDNL